MNLRGARILLAADAVGGVWTYALDLAAGLAGAGAGVRIAVLGPPLSPEASAEAARFDLVHLDHPLDWMAASPTIARAAADALAAEARGFDLVHLHSPAYALAAYPCPVAAVHHSCVATWWAAARGGDLPPDLAWRAAMVGEGLSRADAVLAPTRAHAEAVRRCYGLDAAPIAVHNGRAAPPAAEATPGGTFVFTVGRLWDGAKNLALLDAAAASLPVPVRAAGATVGPNGASIVLRHVEALGACSSAEVRRLLAQRPIYASPALYEPFGLAVLEAAQAGCPLLLADISTFRELWQGAAAFVDPRNPAAWADALAVLVADAPRRDAMGEAARRRASAYSVEAMVAGTLAVHAGLLARKARPAA